MWLHDVFEKQDDQSRLGLRVLMTDSTPLLSHSIVEAFHAIAGDHGFVAEPADMEPYLVDERGTFRGISPLLLKPSSTEEVAGIVRLCAKEGIGIVPQGGRTGLCGGAVPDQSGTEIMLSLERMNRIRELDAQGFTVTCEAGCVLRNLQEAAEAVDRLFPLSLAAEGSCMIGGNLSTNAGGVNVLRYGMARNLTLGLEVVLPDGSAWDGLTSLRKDNRGYDLKQLFIGAEGTLGIITAATLALHPRPRDVETLFLAVPSPAASVELLSLARENAADMIVAFELNDRKAIDMVLRHMPNTRDVLAERHNWYVLLEMNSSIEGQAYVAGERILEKAMEGGLCLDGVRASSLAQRAGIWALRENVNEAQKREGRSLKHDIAVPIACVPDFIEEATETIGKISKGARVLAFGHVGDGNVHFNVFPPESEDEGAFLAAAPSIESAVFEISSRMRGSFSAEHGIGVLKRAALERYAAAGSLQMMRTLKQAIDPKGIMNPGKVVWGISP